MTAASTAALVASLCVCWAMGFGVGKAVAWTRKLVDVA